jgi:hypothetical protein
MMFYVYAYLRSKDSSTAKIGTPYYIGKGKGDRAWKKHVGAQKPKDNKFIVMLETCLTEIGAFALERRLINWWGRKDLGTGILLNRTDGGDGSSGLIFPESAKKILSELNTGKVVSVETREKLSVVWKGRKQTTEHSENIIKSRKNNGRPWFTEEAKKKISDSKKGKKMSPESIKKMSESLKGHKGWNKGISTGPRPPEQIENMKQAWIKRKEKPNPIHEAYFKNPVYCSFCKCVLPFRKRTNQFCNRSCAGKHRNKKIENNTNYSG